MWLALLTAAALLEIRSVALGLDSLGLSWDIALHCICSFRYFWMVGVYSSIGWVWARIESRGVREFEVGTSPLCPCSGGLLASEATSGAVVAARASQVYDVLVDEGWKKR